MGADWGLYSALKGTDNWAQKRQDKMQSLMILDKREQKSQAILQKSAELEQGMQDHFDKIASLDALAQDQGRIADEEKKARRNIYKGIAAVNGNLNTYMTTGGISDLSQYKRDVLNSDAAKNAATNKVNATNFLKDKSEGRYVRGVEIDVPVLDAKGNPKLKNGEIVTKREKVSMERQMDMFNKGLITKIDYGGAENKVKLDPTKFSKTVKDPNNPYTAMPVTTDDIYNYAMEQGASPEYAKVLAVEYGKTAVKSGQPWHWAKENESEDAVNWARANKYAGGGSGKGVSGKTMVTSQMSQKISRISPGGTDVAGPDEKNWWRKVGGVSWNNETNSFLPKGSLTAYDSKNMAEYDLANAANIEYGDYYVDEKGNKYITANVTYFADYPQKKNPNKESSFWEVNSVDDAVKNNWTEGTANQHRIDATKWGYEVDEPTITGEVHIPLNKELSDRFTINQGDKFIGIKTNQYNLAPSGSVEQSGEFAQMQRQDMIDQVADSRGISEDAATIIVEQAIRNSVNDQ